MLGPLRNEDNFVWSSMTVHNYICVCVHVHIYAGSIFIEIYSYLPM